MSTLPLAFSVARLLEDQLHVVLSEFAEPLSLKVKSEVVTDRAGVPRTALFRPAKMPDDMGAPL